MDVRQVITLYYEKHVMKKAAALDLFWRDIEGKKDIIFYFLFHNPGIRTRPVQEIPGQFIQSSALIGQADNQWRGDISRHRVVPPEQCLHSVEFFLVGNLGLIKQLYLSAFDCILQIHGQGFCIMVAGVAVMEIAGNHASPLTRCHILFHFFHSA